MYKVVERLRRAITDMVFRTTFIVGHPGETDADFDELRKFVEWAELDHVGVFLYSPEEGTRSAELEASVDPAVAEARRDELMTLQRPISRGRLELRVGTELDVLVEGVSDESDLLLQGRWWGQAPEVDGSVYLANGTARTGEIRRVLVTDAADYDLMADFIDGPGGRDAPPGAKDPRLPKVKLRTLT
jgi:ribosomal protein S12 methylthiotransferase